MKNFITRLWEALFPIPAVSAREAFLLRALLAAALFWFFPPVVQWKSQPSPVGLAHWMDLTWLSHPGVFPVYRAMFFGLLLLYASGFALPVTLPLMTLVHILPPTLHNSQGFTYHGNQIMSLTLVGLSVMTLWFALAGRKGPCMTSGPGASALVLGVVAAESVLLWFGEKSFSLGNLCGHLYPGGSAFAIGCGNVLLFMPVFLVLAAVPAFLTRTWSEDGAPVAEVRSWTLVTAQFVIASAYLISVFSKFIRSDGMWLINSYYVALDFVKTLRQNYYSGLDPQFAVDPPGYIVTMMQHPVLTAAFFDIGVALEAFMIFAVGHRKWAFAFGASLIFMHCTIAKIMNLFFPTHVAMLAIFWVLPAILGRTSAGREPAAN
ncbi:MAG: hypothetical protein K1X78_26990 [Verrucomicrobiaceae bacterium]|nr:hypothetical protein [Verrucomicrobiaceae bacterium]